MKATEAIEFARKFFEKHPEFELQLCDKIAELYYEIEGESLSPEAAYMEATLFLADYVTEYKSLMDEIFTNEAIECMIREEVERHMDETRGAPAEEVEKAVRARMTDALRMAYPQRFPTGGEEGR